MIAIAFLAPRAPQAAAKRRVAARYASKNHGASGYERSLRPYDARFSLLGSAICSGGDR